MTKKRKKIRSEDIVAVEEATRIPKKDRDPNLYYYEMRHSESDWTQPIGITNFVFVNFLGTLLTNTPLELTDFRFPGDGVLVPTWKEKRIICEKMQESVSLADRDELYRVGKRREDENKNHTKRNRIGKLRQIHGMA